MLEYKKITEVALKEFERFATWVSNAERTIFGYAMSVSNKDMKRMFYMNY